MMLTSCDHDNSGDDGDDSDDGDDNNNGGYGNYKLFGEDDLVLLLPDLLDVRLPLPLDSWEGAGYYTDLV